MYTDKDVKSNTTYYYTVYAVNEAGPGPYSDTVSATVPLGDAGDGEDGGGIPWWLVVAIIVVLIILILLFLLFNK